MPSSLQRTSAAKMHSSMRFFVSRSDSAFVHLPTGPLLLSNAQSQPIALSVCKRLRLETYEEEFVFCSVVNALSYFMKISGPKGFFSLDLRGAGAQ